MASTPSAVITEHVENGSATAPGPDPETQTSSDVTPQAETAAAADATTTAADAVTDAAEAPETENDPTEALAGADTVKADTAEPAAAPEPEPEAAKWPGWPGHCVFRLIVPVLKVGSIIGRKGDLIKKMCEETRARIRVLDGPSGSPDRIVSLSLCFFVFVLILWYCCDLVTV